MEQTEIIKALVKAQEKFPIIKKNRTGQKGNIKHNYADLATIVENTRPICAEFGLCHTFTIKGTEGKQDLVTTLYHESGQTIESIYPLGNIGSMSDKDAGIRISYAKRYSLKAILGVEEEENPDDNGWGADPKGGDNRNNIQRPPRQNQNTRQHSNPKNKTNTGQNTRPPKNHAPGMQDRVTVGELKVLWRVFEQKGFNKEQAAEVIQNEFGKKNVDLTKDEFHKACDLVNSLGTALLEQNQSGTNE